MQRESETLKYSIKQVDKGWTSTMKRLWSGCLEQEPLVIFLL